SADVRPRARAGDGRAQRPRGESPRTSRRDDPKRSLPPTARTSPQWFEVQNISSHGADAPRDATTRAHGAHVAEANELTALTPGGCDEKSWHSHDHRRRAARG